MFCFTPIFYRARERPNAEDAEDAEELGDTQIRILSSMVGKKRAIDSPMLLKFL
jgi:hypothetical protein